MFLMPVMKAPCRKLTARMFPEGCSADPFCRRCPKAGAPEPWGLFFFFLKGAGHGEVGLGPGGVVASWLPPNVIAVPCTGTFLLAPAQQSRTACPPSLSLALCASCPHPLLASMGVFVIVALALGQAWLEASLVGTVCTVSAEPSLSSYTINFFFLIWKGWGEGGGKESVSPMLESSPH